MFSEVVIFCLTLTVEPSLKRLKRVACRFDPTVLYGLLYK